MTTSIRRIFDILDLHVEVLMKLIVQGVVVLFGEKYCGRQTLVRYSTEAAHCCLENEYFWLRAAEKSHSKQRPAVPAFLAFFNEDNELFLVSFRSRNIKVIEVSDIIVLCILCIADIQENLRCRNTEVSEYPLKRRLDLCGCLLNACRIDSKFRIQTFIGLTAVTLPKRGYHSFEEFITFNVLKTERVGIFQETIPDGFTQTVSIYHLRQKLILYIWRTCVVVASHDRGICCKQIDGITKACLIRSARPDLLFEVCTKEVMRLIDIDAELRKPTKFLKTLVIHQRGIIPCIVLIIISAVDCWKERSRAAE